MTFGAFGCHLFPSPPAPLLASGKRGADTSKGVGRLLLGAQDRVRRPLRRLGKAPQCVEACQALLSGPAGAPSDRAAVLRLVGSAYEQLGDFETAARCFAGHVPEGLA